MGTVTKHIDHKDKKGIEGARVEKKGKAGTPVIDLRDDPYFVKKAESAKRLLDKYGTPKK